MSHLKMPRLQMAVFQMGVTVASGLRHFRNTDRYSGTFFKYYFYKSLILYYEDLASNSSFLVEWHWNFKIFQDSDLLVSEEKSSGALF